MPKAVCPDCGEDVQIDPALKIGERFECPECSVELEVVSLKPLEVDYALYDDWDDEDEEWGDDVDWDDEEEEDGEEEADQDTEWDEEKDKDLDEE